MSVSVQKFGLREREREGKEGDGGDGGRERGRWGEIRGGDNIREEKRRCACKNLKQWKLLGKRKRGRGGREREKRRGREIGRKRE